MHKRKVRMRITTASRRILRFGGQSVRAYCPACGREVETLTKREVGEVLEIGAEALSEFIAAGRVHAIPTVSGSIRVCKDSLF